jgi:hypothetical protein
MSRNDLARLTEWGLVVFAMLLGSAGASCTSEEPGGSGGVAGSAVTGGKAPGGGAGGLASGGFAGAGGARTGGTSAGGGLTSCSGGPPCGTIPGQIRVRVVMPALGMTECACETNPCPGGSADCSCAASLCTKYVAQCTAYMPSSGDLVCTQQG